MPPSRQYLVALSLFVGPLARAQEPGETIEVEGERPAGSRHAPAAAGTVIETDQFGGEVRSVAEMLLAAPGVSVHAFGGPGQAATLSLRGSTADQSLVLLDGIPLQGPGGGAVDLSTLPATLLDRVIVSRGVLGAQFGAGALGGALELIPRAARAGFTGGAQIAAGSFGTASVAADAAVAIPNGSALIAVQGDRTAGDFDYLRQVTPEIPDAPYYDFTRENADATRGSGLFRLSRRVTEDADLDLLLQGSAGIRGLPGSSAYPTARSRELDQGGVAGLRVRGTESGVGWSLRAWGRVDRAELRGVSSFGDCQDGAPDCPRDDQRSSSLRGVGGLSVPMGETNAVDLSLAGGADWVHGATGAFRRNVFSAGARDDLAFSEGFSLHPGLRLDAVGGDVGLSPAVAVRWKPAANHPLAVRAGWGLSFRPPTFSELYLDRGGMVGNPELQPERAWSVDSGVEWRIGRLALSAGAFWSRYRDLILYQLFPPARVKPFNVGQARIAGFELQAVVPLPAHLLASLSYSFLDAVNRSDGHSLPYRPPHRLFARLSHRGDRFEGYGELSFTSRFPRNDFDSAFVDSQLLINTGAGVRAAGPLWVDVEIKNLLDNRTYEDLFQYPLPGLSVAVIARARL